jgi:hypothetical protein
MVRDWKRGLGEGGMMITDLSMDDACLIVSISSASYPLSRRVEKERGEGESDMRDERL